MIDTSLNASQLTNHESRLTGSNDSRFTVHDSREKVAIIAPCPFPIDRGTPLRIRRLATALAEKFDIHIITYNQGDPGDLPFAIHRTWPIPLRITRTGANLAKIFYDLLLFFTALHVVRREGIRLIDGHLHEGAFIGLMVRLFTGSRVIYNAHGTFVPELLATGAISARSILLGPLRRFENWVERSVDMIVAQSLLRRDEFLAKGLPLDKVAVVEDVPELEQFRVTAEDIDRGLEKRLRPAGETLLIYSGGMESYQGVDFLLDAFAMLCKKRHDIRLVLFGRPLAEYRLMAEKAGISGRISFVDDEPFSRLPQYLAICHIGFALRLYGGNVPGKLPVYMASGIAVIGTDIEGINTVLKGDRTGVLVATDDLAGLVAQIERLVDDPELRRSLGRAARREAEERYSPDLARNELGRVYREMLL